MTKHQVMHACGHPAEHDLDGRPDQQAWVAKQRAKDPCPVCYRAGVDSENALNAAFAADRDLPALAGTPKQVAWAVTIRADFLADLPAQVPALNSAITSRGGTPLTGVEEALVLLVRLASAEMSAPWWIRNRARLPQAVCKRHARQLRGDIGETARRLLMWVST